MELKFSTFLNQNKVSVKFYQETKLKPIKGSKNKNHPIYFTITYNRRTTSIKSKLWDNLFKNLNSRPLAIGYKERGGHRVLVETTIPSINSLLTNKSLVNSLCAYEFDCIEKMLKKSEKSIKTVYDFIEIYNDLGRDALQIIAKNLIEELIDSKKLTMPKEYSFKADDKLKLSTNTRLIIQDLLSQDYDTLRLISALEELQVLEHASVSKSLGKDWHSFVTLVGDMQFFLPESQESFFSDVRDETPIAIKLGLYYLPIIFFKDEKLLDGLKIIDGVKRNLSDLEKYT